jgi:hypothetical protein
MEKEVARPEPFPQNELAQSLRRRGRLIDPVKENPNTKMLKKYTKYVATAFAVASLSTFIIGCGGEDTAEPTEDPVEMPETEGTDPDEGTEDEPAETKPE